MVGEDHVCAKGFSVMVISNQWTFGHRNFHASNQALHCHVRLISLKGFALFLLMHVNTHLQTRTEIVCCSVKIFESLNFCIVRN